MAHVSPLPHTRHSLSLGAELERQRLAHRAARIRSALSAMHRLADGRGGEVPPPLRHGMADFVRELARVEQRLRDLQTRHMW
jgi:hypothetical protein